MTSVATNLARGVIGFAAGVIVARALGPEGRGEFSLVVATVLIPVVLAGMGMPSALTQAKAKGGRSIAELYSASVVVALIVGAAALLVGVVFYAAVGRSVIKVSQSSDLVWVVVLIVPLLVLNSWTAVAYLEDRIRELGLATISGAIFFLAALLVAQMLGRLTASTAIALWAVSSVLPLVVLLRAARLQVVPNLGAIALALVRFSLRANVVALALVLVWRIDVLLVDWQRGLRELGLYSAAVALAEVLLRIAVSARIALAPQQGSAIGRDLLVMRICRINRLMLAILCVASVVLAIGSTVLVRLAYGPAFVTAAPALVWLLPGVVALILQGPPLDYLVTEGRLRGVTIVTVAALLVNVGLDVLLLPSHGFVVAAVASTVAYILSCVLILVLFARQTGVTFRPLMVVEPRDLALLRAMWGGSRPAPAE